MCQTQDKECSGCGQATVCVEGLHYCKNAFCSTPPSQQHKPDEKLTASYFNFSPVVGVSDNEILNPFFSRFACQTCGNELAGFRHYVTATIGKAHTNREKLEICTDCFRYFFS